VAVNSFTSSLLHNKPNLNNAKGEQIVLRNDICALIQLRITKKRVADKTNEDNWKDTVRVEERGVTRIIVRFDGYSGRFVWHCHTLGACHQRDDAALRDHFWVSSRNSQKQLARSRGKLDPPGEANSG
jgi:hypothetical protein